MTDPRRAHTAILTTLLLAACGGPPQPGGPGPVGAVPEGGYDLLLTGGRIVDGTGNAWHYGEVAIVGDRIVRVARPGRIPSSAAREVVDVRGQVIAPGFVDINGQGDTGLFGSGEALNKIHQGVTTTILGESNTPAPISPDADPPDPDDTTAVRRAEEWRRFGGWLEELESSGVSINVGSFVGGTTVRRNVMGLSERAPTPEEVGEMRDVVAGAMQDGAMGVATALIYPPGAYAGTEELVEIAREAAEHGGIYVSHIRNESYRLLEALDEAIEIGRRSGAPVEIYHLKAAGVDNWALEEAAIRKIDEARAAGVDIQAAMYPYTAASTSLSACLPPWTAADGLLQQNLRDPDTRARIAREMTGPPGEWENWCRLATPEGSLMVGVGGEWQGRTIAELAEATGKPWAEAVMDMLVEEGSIGMVYFAMSEENVARQMEEPWMKFGSDAGVHDPRTATYMTHPRGYGTYPRILGKYVREEGVIGLEEAVRKMTSAVAERVGVRDRGMVREGFYADLVVFDPDHVRETATFTEPHQLAEGVDHLLVNGTFVLRDGEFTGASPGRFVRGPGAGPGSER